MACYFIFAVGYDIYEIILHALHSQMQPPERPPPYHSVHNRTGLYNDTIVQLPNHSRRWRIHDALTNSTH